jgi:predicted glycoside hydrolase/deacetylase ChbG (UPF0249 family)
MNQFAKHLGLADDARIVIPHIDDVGMCHGANQAYIELLGQGFVTSGSVMVPCPWFLEIAEWAREHPHADLGVHLTLTSEWRAYRWRPLSTSSRNSGLIDDEGYMPRTVPALRERVDPAAAEAEMRAQIEMALGAGIEPTHLDTHMGAAATPELLDIYLGLGRAYRLPLLLPRDTLSYLSVLNFGASTVLYTEALRSLEEAGGQFIDRFIMTPCCPPDATREVYQRMLGELAPGVTFFSLHCNAPGEMSVISHDWAVWRAAEYDLAADPGFIDFVRERGLHLAGFREIRDLYRESQPTPIRAAGASG